ncbi:MAG: LytR/AlgR family response regulator transcription factor [Mobilitalea sp.]
MIKIAIVEDEAIYSDQLNGYLTKYQEEYYEDMKITIYSDGEDIIENYNVQFDIILMDIEMRFMNGMKAAETLRKIDKEVIIMFITNSPQYAVNGYSVDALDYILKPITYFSFSQRLNRAISRMKNRSKQFITITNKSGIWKIDCSDIYYIESNGHRLTYITSQGKFESTSISMKKIEQTLKEDVFFRCNSGYLVNLEHVLGIDEDYAIVNKTRLLISRSRKSEFLKALINYMGDSVK